MNKELAIECIKTQRQFVDDMTRDAFDMAIEALRQPEIVHCRDCKYSSRDIGGKDIYCLRSSSYPWHDDSFCSDAERWEDNGESNNPDPC